MKAPRELWAQWTQYTLFTSALVLAAGWLGLAAAAVAAIVAAGGGRGALAVVWLVAGAVGSTVPLCLGTLARTVAFRYQAEQRAQGSGA